MSIGSGEIKQGILLLWGLWLALVTLLNVLDGLKMAGKLPAGWRFHSHNFDGIVLATRTYDAPLWLCWAMYGAVTLWEGLAAFLLLRAGLHFSAAAAYLAFFVSLALWGAFIMVNELFLTFLTEASGGYSTAATHRSLFTSFLVSCVAVAVLP
ncbi:hypothetical protein [Deinococcus sp.]|uniref:hypothetical protein n=1 Tax=Deinococcus sp. TaxID=47478 RepID=UPI003CC5DBD3